MALIVAKTAVVETPISEQGVPEQVGKGRSEMGRDARDREDCALLAGIARGEMQSFERLYRRYYGRVFGFAGRITHRMDSAEEVVNDTMLTVWRKAESFAGRSRASTWILGIAYRKALRARSRARPEHEELELEDVADPGQSERLDAIFSRDQLIQALDRLPPEQRAVVELTYVHGYKYTEIAEIAGCPVGTVKTRMRNAREKLRHMLAGLDLGN